MKILSIVCVAWAGYRLATSGLRVRSKLTVLTVLLAALLHTAVWFALPHDVIELYANAHRWSPVLIPIAMLETAGIWVTVILIPWAERSIRLAATAYLVGAAAMGALSYYQPFETLITNGRVEGPVHPSYEVALMAALIFAMPSIAIGVMVKRRRLRIRSAQDPIA